MSVVAPMPIPSVRMMAIVYPGRLKNMRQAKAISLSMGPT